MWTMSPLRIRHTEDGDQRPKNDWDPAIQIRGSSWCLVLGAARRRQYCDCDCDIFRSARAPMDEKTNENPNSPEFDLAPASHESITISYVRSLVFYVRYFCILLARDWHKNNFRPHVRGFIRPLQTLSPSIFLVWENPVGAVWTLSTSIFETHVLNISDASTL